jgi:hypothetical protein
MLARNRTRRLENPMPFVKKEILDRLLTDEQDWNDLLAERATAAHLAGYETAQAAAESQVSLANQLTADANARIDELGRELVGSRGTIDAMRKRNTQLTRELHEERSNTDRSLRSQAMGEAITLATMREGLDPLAAAKEFEKFLRGEADPVHNDEDRVDGLEESVRLVNSGWNSALEYLRGELYGKMPEDDYVDVAEFLPTLKREA